MLNYCLRGPLNLPLSADLTPVTVTEAFLQNLSLARCVGTEKYLATCAKRWLISPIHGLRSELGVMTFQSRIDFYVF